MSNQKPGIISEHSEIAVNLFKIGVTTVTDIELARGIFLDVLPKSDMDNETLTQEDKEVKAFNQYWSVVDSVEEFNQQLAVVKAANGGGKNEEEKQSLQDNEQSQTPAVTTQKKKTQVSTEDYHIPSEIDASVLEKSRNLSEQYINKNRAISEGSTIINIYIDHKPVDYSDREFSVHQTVEKLNEYKEKLIDTEENRSKFELALKAAEDKSIKFPARAPGSKGREIAYGVQHPKNDSGKSAMEVTIIKRDEMFQRLAWEFSAFIPSGDDTAGAEIQDIKKRTTKKIAAGGRSQTEETQLSPQIRYVNRQALYEKAGGVIEVDKEDPTKTTTRLVNLDHFFEIMTKVTTDTGTVDRVRKIYVKGQVTDAPVYVRTPEDSEIFGELKDNKVLRASEEAYAEKTELLNRVLIWSSTNPSQLPEAIASQVKDLSNLIKTTSQPATGMGEGDDM